MTATARAPRVSVIIPTYNSGPYLEVAVVSILTQTMPDLELVIYDDGSSDGTLDKAEEFAARDHRVRVVRGHHVGIAQARNNGFASTNPATEFITFFDHDDVWEKHALSSLLAALEAHPECPAAHAVARCIDSHGVQFPHDDHAKNMRERMAVVGNDIVSIPRSAPTSFGALLIKNYITTPGTSLVRRSALEAVGGFEHSAVPCDDWDLNLRLSRLGDFAFVDDELLNWRRHAQATSNSSKRWRRGYMVTRRRSVSAVDNTASQRHVALVALRKEVLRLQFEAVAALRSGGGLSAAKKLARSLLLGSIYIGSWIPSRT